MVLALETNKAHLASSVKAAGEGGSSAAPDQAQVQAELVAAQARLERQAAALALKESLLRDAAGGRDVH